MNSLRFDLDTVAKILGGFRDCFFGKVAPPLPPPKFNRWPLKTDHPNRKGLSSNHHFSGAKMLNFQGVKTQKKTEKLQFQVPELGKAKDMLNEYEACRFRGRSTLDFFWVSKKEMGPKRRGNRRLYRFEPKNVGLVQMIFLLNWVIFRCSSR